MIYLNIRFAAADYTQWRAAFDARESVRRAAGATGVQQVFRDLENPNTVTLVMEWQSADQARKFAQDPALREAMEKSGVIGAPEIRFLNQA
jgi:quinol monooxygenase YgiN